MHWKSTIWSSDLDLWPLILFSTSILYIRSLHLWIHVDIHLPFKFQPPTTNIKRFRYFQWRVSIYRSVAHKTGSRSSHLLSTFRRGGPAAHFFFNFIANVTDSVSLWNIVIYITYLTFDLNLWHSPKMSRWKINLGPI